MATDRKHKNNIDIQAMLLWLMFPFMIFIVFNLSPLKYH